MTATTSLTAAMRAAANHLADTLDTFAGEPYTANAIGHQVASGPEREQAAASLKMHATKIAAELRSLGDDTLEVRLIAHDLRNETVNMDHSTTLQHMHDRDLVGTAYSQAFDAAIARRDDREGFRRVEGHRERRTATGWERY